MIILNNGCKYEIVIPCLKLFTNAIDEESSNHKYARIFLEIAARCTSQLGINIKFYRTHPISVALMDAFDPEWINNQKKEAIECLNLLYASTLSYEFESQLPPQQSTFEKAKIFSDITDYPNISSICIVSTDEKIEEHRKLINEADKSFDYSSIVVKSPLDWMLEQITNKTQISSIVANVLIKELDIFKQIADKK